MRSLLSNIARHGLTEIVWCGHCSVFEEEYVTQVSQSKTNVNWVVHPYLSRKHLLLSLEKCAWKFVTICFHKHFPSCRGINTTPVAGTVASLKCLLTEHNTLPCGHKDGSHCRKRCGQPHRSTRYSLLDEWKFSYWNEYEAKQSSTTRHRGRVEMKSQIWKAVLRIG